MPQDRFGLPLTTTSDAAADAYVAGLDLLLSANAGVGDRLDRALTLDPDFALAHITRARLLQMQARGPEAMAAVARAREHTDRLSERERRHIAAIALAVEGKGRDALSAVLDHVQDYPRDALVLSLALGVYGLLGFSGRVDHHEAQRDLLESLAPHWPEDWWFLTYRGWSQVETGTPANGTPLLDRALELNPRNAHGAHARAHGYYEMGEAEAGMAFIDAWLPDYDRAAQLHCHLSWHLALFALQLGDNGKALALYAANIRPAVAKSPPLFTLADSASFLWRLAAYGGRAQPADWREVGNLALANYPHAGLAFADVHAALAAAANGADALIDQRLNELSNLVDSGRLPAGPVVGQLCKGIAAFAAGAYDDCIHALEAALPDLPRIGGSHAQRDVIEDTLIIARLRADQVRQARAAVAERKRQRAGHLDDDWLDRVAAA